jgi:outer membrane protein assembly factor BamD (BamD/ComL family)
MAFDRGEFAIASAWFDTASREGPGGPLAREIAGRQIEAREKGGDHAAARDAATSYLSHFPSGPYASFARSVLER